MLHCCRLCNVAGIDHIIDIFEIHVVSTEPPHQSNIAETSNIFSLYQVVKSGLLNVRLMRVAGEKTYNRNTQSMSRVYFDELLGSTPKSAEMLILDQVDKVH